MTFVLAVPSAASTLEEELERERLEAWFVVMLAFVAFSPTSINADEFESERLEV